MDGVILELELELDGIFSSSPRLRIDIGSPLLPVESTRMETEGLWMAIWRTPLRDRPWHISERPTDGLTSLWNGENPL